ncbi:MULTISPECIES: YadA-like family protein [unclassified Burkholderia]|uniref:YadA-like family protein n=1 Tax=unclassified Burkholderia TaxID=2613784 RepID=UPI001F04ACB8|nr:MULTISPECIES: YadA-like family protein [unclassified Burkholderia]
MGSAYADEVDAADPALDDPIHLTDAKQDDPQALKRSVPDTRAVVTDNSAYVKINAKGDGTDNASATGVNALAIGSKAAAKGENSVAIGTGASTVPTTLGGGAVAIGDTAAAAGNNVALGAKASALGDQGAIALGGGANASGKASIALGNEAQAGGWGAYALGRKANATAQSALAIGDSAQATRAGTTAIGSQAAAAGENAIAIGQNAAARGADSLALGSYSEADRDQTVSVGTAGFERQIVNVGRGTTATDAVNVAQLKGVTDVLGGNAAVGADGNIKKPGYTIAGKTYDNVGDALLAASESGGGAENAVEYDSTAKNSVTLGGTGSAAVKLTNVRAATLSANSTDAVNGAQLFATNNRVTNVEQSLHDSGLIDPSTGESLAVVYKDATKSTVALGGTGGTTVTNVKAGKVASTSKDAVNGGQLYDVSSSVASALGGETTVNTDGTLSKPTYKVGDKTYNNVGDALQAAASAGGAGGEDANAVHYDGAGKSSVTLGGTGASKPVALKNVATGTAGTDAVNVAQLEGGLSDVKDEIKKDLGDGTLDMKYIKVNATGMQANALGKNSVAIGSTANATNVNTLAIGSGARATGVNSVAIGVNSVATDADTLSVGDVGDTRRIVNVSDGIDAHDAVTMKQLTDAMHTANTQLDQKMTRMTRDVSAKPGSFVAVEGVGADGSLPAVASMNGRDPTLGTAAAIGVSSAAGGTGAIAVGLQAAALSDHSVAIGSVAQTGVEQEYSVAIGSKVTTNGPGALAIGSRAKANGENAVAVGNNGVMAIGKSSIAIGDKATTTGSSVNGVALGKSASVEQNATDAIALGANARVASGNNGGIALGANSVANRGNALSVGSNSLQRQVVNVAKGTQDNDAVNVSQLKGVTNALGGGAGIDTDGSIKAPTYKVGDTTYNNVGDALDAMAKNGGSDPNAVAYDSAAKDKVTLAGKTGTTLSNVKAGTADMDAVNVSQLKSSGLIDGDGKSLAAITYDKNADGTPNYKSATLAGAGGTKLTNVKAAELSATSTDAVNGSQLFATNENLGNLKDTLTDGGVIDKKTGESLAVVYDSTSKDKVTLAGKTGTTLSNVKAGTADLDAVNVSQLKSSGLIDGDGKLLAAITYDKNADGTPNYKSATLAGAGGTKLTNVKAAELSATSTDAVNGSQLFATNENLGNLKDTLTDGGVIDKKTGESLAVVYDSTSKDKVTLAGKTGTTLSNVKAGTADLDAVNVSQLKSSGLIDGDGKSIAAVTYDKKTDGTPNYNSVTLGGGKSTGPVTLSNVAQGKANTDAVNVEQLTKAISDVEGGMNPLAVSYDTVAKDKVTLTGEKGTTLTNLNAGKVSADSKDAVNGSQLYGTAKSVADVLGGGSTVDESGKVKAPTYTLVDPSDDKKKVDYHTVGDALENLDGRVAGNTGDITNIKNQFKETGLVDADGDTRAAVTYDKNKDGTPNYKSATLAGAGGTKLTNVAAGTADMDAVNVSQLKSSGLIDGDGKSIAAVTYDKKTDGTPNYESVTLAGKTGTKLTNVKAAELSATSTDAVNGSQLFATNENLGNLKDTLTDGGVIDKKTGESLAVVYDSTSKDKVTLAGKTGTTLSNVKAGTADLDAVNVSQLKSSGLIDGDGKSIAAVTYDKKTDGTPNYNSVTLGGGKSTGPVTLSNVAQGKAGTDAVNVDQLTKAISDVEGGMNPLAVAYDNASKDKVTLAGKTGTTLSNVAAGKADTDAVNVSQLKSSGLVDGDGKSRAAVTYDKNADGTPNFKSATLAGVGGTTLSNVADGKADKDAVNVSQLKSSGLIDGDGKALAALTYDKNADGTPNFKSATLAGVGGTTLSNVADGKADKDAVNVSQLKSSGLVDGDGKSRAAVTYDKNADGTPNFKSATLAGVGGTTLSNVAAGKADKDAVNVSQLKSSGLIDGDGKALAAVTYDKNADGTPNYKSATLAGVGGTTLSNVADGKADKDAVNVSQLKSSGLIDGDGKALAALTYDKNADGTPNYKSATLAGVGGTTLSNVADGKADKDAVNVSQLKSSGLIGEDGKSRAAVTYDKNADGTPNYKSATLAGVGGTTLSNVADGKADKDAVNVSQLKSSGLIGDDGKSRAAVTYDKNADGTPNYNSATLAGAGGTKLSNVADGKADKDAVNVSQLKSSGLIDGDGKSLAAVTYDKNKDGTPNYKSVTLAGVGGTKLTNVKAAELSATSTDAVNGSQLFATNENLGNLKDALTDGGVIDEKTGESLAVVYDSTSKDKVTLSGEKGTTLTNVKAGTADLDAVNVSQLKSSGLIDGDGKSIAAVTYDRNTDGTPNYNSVTLGGGKSTGPVTLSNVAKGQAGTDAVNVDQLDDMYDRLTNGSIDLKYIKVYSKDGLQANALGTNSVAIGPSAVATKPYTLALGSGARANGAFSVAIGANSIADDDNTVSVGDVEATRRIVNVSDGIDAHDAVTMKQLTDAMHTANTQLDQKMTRMTRDVSAKPGSFVAVEGVGADGSLPAVASMNGRDPNLGTAAAIGVASAAGGTGAIAIGLQAAALSDHSVAIGSVAQTGVEQEYSVAIGSKVTTNGPGALAIGSRAKANGENAVAVGNNGVMAIGKSSIAMGDKATTMGGSVNSIAIGTNATVNQNVADAVALGANSKALQSNSVALGAGSLADRANALSIGAAGAERQIVHVAKGTQNTDAVNLSQLKGLADVVGGGTGFDANGDVTAPTYTIDGKEYHNVNDALQAAAKSGGDGSSGTDPNAVAYDGEQKDKVTLAGQNGTTLSNVAAGKADTDAVNVSQLKSSGLIGEDGKSVAAVTYGKNTDGTPNYESVTLAGETGTKLTNVKAAELSATSTDAVNGSQLFATNENLGNLKDALTNGGVVDKTTGESLAVVYDSTSKDTVKLAGEKGTTLSNVAAGKADLDAVNVSQLKSSGLIGENGKALAAVTYDTHADGTTNFASVTFGGMNAGVPVALHNVAAGKTSTDAVNVSQLKGVTDVIGGGTGIDADGKITAPVYTVDGKDYASVGDAIKALEQREGGTGNGTNPNAVVYDNATKDVVTLAGAKGTVIRNVADGSLADTSTEAVNGGQVNYLAQSIADSLGGGAKFDPATGDISAPTYELTAADGLTNTYDNVGDAFKHVDERVSTHTTQIESLEKGVANAVQYDNATHTSVTLGGAGTAPVMLKNVADGVDETDAVNVRQLRSAGLVGEDGKLQSAVVYDKNADGTTNYGSVTLGGVGAATPVALHNVAAGKAATDAVNVSQLSGVTDALGGGAKIDENGNVVAPDYKVGGNSFNNAGDALTDIDGRVKEIQKNLGDVPNLSGAVAYDKNADGTVNFGKVTLGNGQSSGPVVLTNVADGKSRYDAVNFGQYSELKGRVDKIDEHLSTATTPGDGNNGNNGNSGKNGNDLVHGTGGSGKDKADILAANPGTGNGNIAVGSDSQIADGKNNGTAIGAGSKVQADDGTALGHGATVSSGATNSVALGSGSKATEANTVSIGSDGHERRLVNVADAVNKTDAVNKGQLDRAIGGMQGQINDMSRNAYSGIAAATALTMIPGVDPGKTLSFGIAGASYKGYQAVAMGGEARITENLKMRAGVSLSSGGNTFGAGASYQW